MIATTKAMTVGTAAAIAEGFLSRINVHFKFVRSLVRSGLIDILFGTYAFSLSKNAHLDWQPLRGIRRGEETDQYCTFPEKPMALLF